ncbi:MAG: hypothetical protein GTO18_18930 [Anaerolineales bacterium]|nr:hypothetical protein [Anaerolineales bacterium]
MWRKIVERVFPKEKRILIIQIVILILILIPVVRIFFPSLFIFPWFYRCVPTDPEPDPYLVKACEYVRKHGVRSAAGNPVKSTIREMFEVTEEDGSQIIFIYLDCCGDNGDMIRIDKQTGEVLNYVKGFFVY